MVIQVGTGEGVIVECAVWSCYRSHLSSCEIWEVENRSITTILKTHFIFLLVHFCFTKEVKNIFVLLYWLAHVNRTLYTKTPQARCGFKTFTSKLIMTLKLKISEISWRSFWGNVWEHSEWQGSFKSIISTNAKTDSYSKRNSLLELWNVFPVSPTQNLAPSQREVQIVNKNLD